MQTQNTEMTRPQASSLSESADVVNVLPPVDIYENADEILVVADFPGVAREALTVRLESGELLIEGTQTPPDDPSGGRLVRFSRAFRVPNTIDPAGVTAQLSQGVLRVHLAKSEKAKPRRIEVKVS